MKRRRNWKIVTHAALGHCPLRPGSNLRDKIQTKKNCWSGGKDIYEGI